jgi:hypothetical protein
MEPCNEDCRNQIKSGLVKRGWRISYKEHEMETHPTIVMTVQNNMGETLEFVGQREISLFFDTMKLFFKSI